MGISLFSGGGGCDCPGHRPDPRNPDPSSFEVLALEQIEDFLVVRMRYPNCTNYEGEKILVYEGVKARDFLARDTVDPHFQEEAAQLLIARFFPTERGWQYARLLCFELSLKGKGKEDG